MKKLYALVIVKQVNWFKNYVKTAMENMQIDKKEES